MKTRIQAALWVAAALYMAWGLGLLLGPGVSHGLVSTGPYDSATTAMFGAALLGMMVTFLIAAHDPQEGIVRASAAGMAIVGLTAAYLIFIGRTMPLSAATVLSLVADLGAFAVLFLSGVCLDLKCCTPPGRRRKRRRR